MCTIVYAMLQMRKMYLWIVLSLWLYHDAIGKTVEVYDFSDFVIYEAFNKETIEAMEKNTGNNQTILWPWTLWQRFVILVC